MEETGRSSHLPLLLQQSRNALFPRGVESESEHADVHRLAEVAILHAQELSDIPRETETDDREAGARLLTLNVRLFSGL